MNNEFSTIDYYNAFKMADISNHYIKMLLAHYFSPEKTLTATQMAKAMGYKNFNAANLHYGRLGRIIGEKLGWNPMPDVALNVIAEFEKPEREWLWIMREEVINAIEMLGLVENDQVIIPEEIDSREQQYYEGSTSKITINVFERNPIAREKCILHYGCKCSVCGIVLSEVYGEVAQGHIHVHHLKQLAEIYEEYQVDPVNDLRPVCPNCHVIIHMRKPPYTIDEVKKMIEKTINTSASMR
jgi:5-methylcytosine-specific restriction enzyme A